jgi:hypothetical protein
LYEFLASSQSLLLGLIISRMRKGWSWIGVRAFIESLHLHFYPRNPGPGLALLGSQSQLRAGRTRQELWFSIPCPETVAY